MFSAHNNPNIYNTFLRGVDNLLVCDMTTVSAFIINPIIHRRSEWAGRAVGFFSSSGVNLPFSKYLLFLYLFLTYNISEQIQHDSNGLQCVIF